MNKKHRNSKMSQFWSKDPIVVETPIGRGVSVVFSWQIDKAVELAKKEGLELIGGPGAILSGMTPPDAGITLIHLHNQYATFTTRGCINCCEFCAVPKIEGKFRELKEWKPNPLICDNNIFASSQDHFIKVIDSVIKFEQIDFNQGLDSYLLKDYHLQELQRVKKVTVRFSFDNIKYESSFVQAVEKTRRYGFKDIRSYVLIGFNDTPDDALYRLELCKKLGVLPNPMRYQPIDTKVKNSYVDRAWTDYELKRMMRYWANLRITQNIPYKEFDPKLTGKKVIRKKEIKMTDKIEEQKKCLKHQDTLLIPSKTNPNRLVCPECIDRRIMKAIETKKRNKKAIAKINQRGTLECNSVKINFDEYEELLKTLSESAKNNFRSLENEILFTINNCLSKK